MIEIIEENISFFLHQLSFLPIGSNFNFIQIVLLFKFGIRFIYFCGYTFVGSLHGFVHNEERIQDFLRNVKRQQCREYQVHHGDHFLPRGFFISSHFLIFFMEKSVNTNDRC